MTDLKTATIDQVPLLGDICYRAFKDVHDRHGFPSDFDSPEHASLVIGGLIRIEDCYSVITAVDGVVAGSNFLLRPDEVGAVGPVSVDPGLQAKGLGRALMEDVLRHARDSGTGKVRLMQDAFNAVSLSLYASLGFDTRAPVAVLDPASKADVNTRALVAEDLDAVEELSTRIYRVSRRNEVAHYMQGPFQPWVRERSGRIAGYYISGVPGHGVAETEEDMAALVLHAASQMPPGLARSFCPLTGGGLYRRLLANGCRTRKVMNLMTMGPYEEPEGAWMPSVAY